MVGLGRIELPTSPLSGVRSSQLSYRPGGLSQSWWSWSGSNRRPPECKSGALPAELQPLIGRRRLVCLAPPPLDLIEASWMQKPRDQLMAVQQKLTYALSGGPERALGKLPYPKPRFRLGPA